MLKLFLNNLLPVFLASGAGYILAGVRNVPARPLTHVGFYILAPCLVFRLLVENPVSLERASQIGFVVILALGIPALAAALVGRALGWSRTLIAAVTLAVFLPNVANFGLSATQFAFGEEAMTQAGVFFVITSILTYTVGVLVASLGRASLGQAFKELIKLPTLWAVLAGILLITFKVGVPLPLERTIYLLADACIPVFLLILGMQLRTMRWKGALAPLSLVVALRLVGGALVGLGVAKGLGMTGPGYQAAVLESGMPVAVITIVLATEYDIEPEFVTTAVFVSTLVCPLTLTPLMNYLG